MRRLGPLGSALGIGRWILLGAVSGALAGVASFIFLEGLSLVTDARVGNEWLVLGLPVAGLGIGLANHRLAGRASRGNALLLAEIHTPSAWVPRRMAPMVLIGTWVTHLFGGSAGREGTALQMSGSLSDLAGRVLKIKPEDRSMMLTAALGGGFGSVFGVPFAGAIFGFEVRSPTPGRFRALVPTCTASIVGDAVVRVLGHEHALRARISSLDGTWRNLLVALAGIAFGIAAVAFVEAVGLVRRAMARLFDTPTWRPVLGAFGVLGLAALFGDEYLGLSLPLLDSAVSGDTAGWWVWALKIVFTAVTIGSGFPGGEVTPLFVIGATLGAALAGPLGLPVALLAAVGMVAVFGAAAKTPIACAVMGVELFGAGAVLPFAMGCVIAFAVSGNRTIYELPPKDG
ncbi:MAG: chloride channel protein [Ilumatobacteraceae bacterium]